MAFSFRHIGSFDKTLRFLGIMTSGRIFRELGRQAQKGVDALARETPVDSGLTASSWSYEITNEGGDWSIVWNNSNINQGVNIAIILHFGHGTGTGGYVAGRNYITPAIAPVFEEIAEDVWKAVTSA